MNLWLSAGVLKGSSELPFVLHLQEQFWDLQFHAQMVVVVFFFWHFPQENPHFTAESKQTIEGYASYAQPVYYVK